MTSPALLLVAHGSRDHRARVDTEALAERVRAHRPELEVAVAYLEHADPPVRDMIGELYRRGARQVVVVPLLLTAAYHSEVDLPRQLEQATAPRNGLTVRRSGVLGPDPLLLAGLDRRIQEAGAPSGDPEWGLVVAAAGTRDRAALASVASVAGELRQRGWGATVAGFAAAARPSVAEAVAELRRTGVSRVVVGCCLLASGRFSDLLLTAGGDVVSAPLGDAPEIAELVLLRYDGVARGPWDR